MMGGLLEFVYRLLNPIEENIRACTTMMLPMDSLHGCWYWPSYVINLPSLVKASI